MRFTQYKNYIWVYLLGTILILLNCVIGSNMYVYYACLGVLYCILFYKGIHILFCYKQTEMLQYQASNKSDFHEKYVGFRIKVLAFWLAFVGLCILGKFVVKMDHQYFYGCTFFFLLLDRWFVNEGCLLQKFSDPQKEVVLCCCGCPCRGWDLLMIHTPLLFAINHQSSVENLLICLSSLLAVISILCWEKEKYKLVEVREKCVKSCDLNLCREHKL